MQRSQAPAFIAFVFKVMKRMGIHALPPEAFRRAKLNDASPQLTSRLWRALHDLVLLNLVGFDHERADTIPERMKLLFDEIQDEDLATVIGLIKHHLSMWDYPAADTLCSMTFEVCESRELLLALAWLLAKVDIFQRYLDQQHYVLSKSNRGSKDEGTLLPPYPYDTSSLESNVIAAEAKCASVQEEFKSMLESKGEDSHATTILRINQIKLMHGKLNATQRSISSLERKYADMIHQIQTEQSDPKHRLTPYEMYLLKNPAILDAHHRQLTVATQMLQLKQECEAHQMAFWEFINTILDERNKSRGQGGDNDNRNNNNNNSNPNINGEYFQQSQESLFTILMEASDKAKKEISQREREFGLINNNWENAKQKLQESGTHEYERTKQVLQPVADQVTHQFSIIKELYAESLSTIRSGGNRTNTADISSSSPPLPPRKQSSKFSFHPHYHPPAPKNAPKPVKFSPYFPSSMVSAPQAPAPAPEPSDRLEIEHLRRLTDRFDIHLDSSKTSIRKLLDEIIAPVLDARDLDLIEFSSLRTRFNRRMQGEEEAT